MKPSVMTNQAILTAIGTLQDIQKINRPDSAAWVAASTLLAELFAEIQNPKRANLEVTV